MSCFKYVESRPCFSHENTLSPSSSSNKSAKVKESVKRRRAIKKPNVLVVMGSTASLSLSQLKNEFEVFLLCYKLTIDILGVLES
jgi:hypothetical protein